MSKNTLIIPVAADRPEYERYLPEWLDIHPDGTLMLYESVRGLPLSDFDRICPVILAKHDQRYHASAMIESQFQKMGLRNTLDIVRLQEPTASQPETVVRAIEAADIRGSIFIKDGDNFFEGCRLLGENCVATFPLDALKNVNPSNKSYIMLDDNQYITNIIEKVIISRFFCVGGYGFAESAQFVSYYKRLAHYKGLYISHVIYAMLLDRHLFRPLNVSNYIDWGTRQEWLNFKNHFVTLFVPLTALLPARSVYSSMPGWTQTTDVEELRRSYDTGKTKIIILCEEDESSRSRIEEELSRTGVKYHQLLFGVYAHARLFRTERGVSGESN